MANTVLMSKLLVLVISTTTTMTIPTTKTSPPSPGAWLGSSCTTNADCSVQNSECLAGQCLCTPGYFFYRGSGTCHATCSNMIDIYVYYKGGHISGNHFGSAYMEWEECRDLCLNDPLCVGFDYDPETRTCFLHYLTHFDGSLSAATGDTGFSQRMCA